MPRAMQCLHWATCFEPSGPVVIGMRPLESSDGGGRCEPARRRQERQVRNGSSPSIAEPSGGSGRAQRTLRARQASQPVYCNRWPQSQSRLEYPPAHATTHSETVSSSSTCRRWQRRLQPRQPLKGLSLEVSLEAGTFRLPRLRREGWQNESVS